MYTIKHRVRFSELDYAGKLSLGSMLDYFQDIATSQSTDLGFGWRYLAKTNRAWILNYWQVEIDELPDTEDEITIGTIPYNFNRFIGERNCYIKDKAGRMLVRCNSVWSLFDMEKGFPSSIPDNEMYPLGKALEMDYKPRKIKTPDNWTEVGTFVITKDRIDKNLHTNNSQYVKLACNYLPEGQVKAFRVEYKKSMMLDEMVRVKTIVDDKVFYLMFESEAGESYAVLEFEFKEEIC